MKSETIYIKDIDVKLDMDLLPIPFVYKDLFSGLCFESMEELNKEIQSAAYCALKAPVSLGGCCPKDRREFEERMKKRKARYSAE